VNVASHVSREKGPGEANDAVPLGHSILQDLGLEILKIKRSDPCMSQALQELLRRCLATVRQVWPDVENVPGA
jgi:hypothetical protein